MGTSCPRFRANIWARWTRIAADPGALRMGLGHDWNSQGLGDTRALRGASLNGGTRCARGGGPALRVLGMGGLGCTRVPLPWPGRRTGTHLALSGDTGASRSPRHPAPRTAASFPGKDPSTQAGARGAGEMTSRKLGVPGDALRAGLSRRAQVRCGEETLHPGLRLADWSLSALGAPERPATHSHLQDREGLSHTRVQIQGCFHVGREVREGHGRQGARGSRLWACGAVCG